MSLYLALSAFLPADSASEMVAAVHVDPDTLPIIASVTSLILASSVDEGRIIVPSHPFPMVVLKALSGTMPLGRLCINELGTTNNASSGLLPLAVVGRGDDTLR